MKQSYAGLRSAKSHEAWLRHTDRNDVRFASCERSECFIETVRFLLHVFGAFMPRIYAAHLCRAFMRKKTLHSLSRRFNTIRRFIEKGAAVNDLPGWRYFASGQAEDISLEKHAELCYNDPGKSETGEVIVK